VSDEIRLPVVGMVGAGQLARMTAQAAISLGVEFRVLADTAEDSAAQVCVGTVIGDYRSAGDLLKFAAGCDVVTFDHEHVPAEFLADLERVVAVRPGAAALRFAQDKLAMRDRLSATGLLAELGVRCPRYRPVSASTADVLEHDGGWPIVLKATSGGYDGKGVWICASKEAAAEVISHGIGLLAEEYIPFDRELAVLVARSPKGQGSSYPVVQTVQRDGICREVIAPAPGLDPDVAVRAQRLGLALAAELGVTGLLAIELFEVGGELVINELAMRPHNCGHWTIDGAVTSQFEQHLRAVLDLPLGSTTSMAPSTVMVNVLGGDDPDLYSRFVHVMAADPGVAVHLYGKRVRPGRKVGHVTVTGADVERLRDRAWRAANYLSLGTEEPDEEIGS
jgi:5-(carboxyamino)imidazole ribonucleotide synthase